MAKRLSSNISDAKRSIYEHSSASLSSSSSFLVSSLSFYNFSSSFLKHGNGLVWEGAGTQTRNGQRRRRGVL